MRNWRWWVFGGAALLVICMQLALAKFTHPPYFGIDPSGGPLVQWSPQPFYYFENYFFVDPTYGASITVVSSLAVIGTIVGLFRKDAMRLYLAAFWFVPTAVVSLILLTKDTRYVFLSVPFVFALAACGTVDIIDALRHVVARGMSRGPRRLFVEALAALSVVAIMLSLIGGAERLRDLDRNGLPRQRDPPLARLSDRRLLRQGTSRTGRHRDRRVQRPQPGRLQPRPCPGLLDPAAPYRDAALRVREERPARRHAVRGPGADERAHLPGRARQGAPRPG